VVEVVSTFPSPSLYMRYEAQVQINRDLSRLLEEQAEEVARLKDKGRAALLKKQLDEVLTFLRSSTYGGPKEIVSTGILTSLEISNARAAGTLYVEPTSGLGLGWVVRTRRVLEMVEKDRDAAQAEITRLSDQQRIADDYRRQVAKAQARIASLEAALDRIEKRIKFWGDEAFRKADFASAEDAQEILKTIKAEREKAGVSRG
jgi:hypothetical protein